ncbi:MAG TPA: hypothetical protein VGM90_05190 [Kofleriaceae bacterium]|jgi:hypothetical protein
MVDFDELVLAMRAARTDEGIRALYEQLFLLEEWFLPVDPEQPGTPMQWRFQGGLDPTPCILAYTDVDRAKRQANEVAASFGKSGEVMIIDVKDAVSWMLSGDLGVSWACFNLGAGSANFPLHFAQLETLAASFGIAPTTSNEAFFPPDYKEFPFREGDLCASQRADGKFALSKVLKIDKVVLRAGESLSIQNQRFTTPVNDFLLVISCALGAAEFDSLEQARAAAASNKWTLAVGHVPNRPPGAAADKIRVGSAPVTEEELKGYRLWRDAFDKGEAGIF